MNQLWSHCLLPIFAQLSLSPSASTGHGLLLYDVSIVEAMLLSEAERAQATHGWSPSALAELKRAMRGSVPVYRPWVARAPPPP